MRVSTFVKPVMWSGMRAGEAGNALSSARLRNQRLRRLPYRADVSVALPPKRNTGYARARTRVDDVSVVLRYGLRSG
jgi:hypothetical protein